MNVKNVAISLKRSKNSKHMNSGTQKNLLFVHCANRYLRKFETSSTDSVKLDS